MVKKKTRRKVIKPPQPKLETVFNCCECGQKKTVAVKFDRKAKIGYLRCKACNVEFETKLRPADAYIDVYYRWVDEIEKEKERSSDEEKEEKDKNEEKEYEEEEAHDSESEKNKSIKEEEDEDDEKEEIEGEEEEEEKEEKEERVEEDEDEE